MTKAGHIHYDERSFKLNGRMLQRLYRLAKPYWVRHGAGASWLVLALILLLIPTYSFLGAYISIRTRDYTNALVAKQGALFWYFFWLTIGLMGLRYGAYLCTSYVQARLILHWRRWLTTYLVDEYLEHRTYFEITVDQSIDNPDQRIQEEVDPFCRTMGSMPQMFFGSFADITLQAAILWHISHPLFYAVIAFAAFKTVVSFFLYVPTIKQNFESTVAEADLRFGLLNVRDNAETVAFYRGEHAEREHILQRLAVAINKALVLNIYGVRVMGVIYFFMIGWAALPTLFLAPIYLKGGLSGFGAIQQGIASGTLILQSLTLLMNFLPTISMAAPHVIRLAEIHEKFEALGERRRKSGAVGITIGEGAIVTLQRVTLQTPGGEQQLVRNLSVNVNLGDHLIIAGQTGVGKSSVLRAVAGLWTRGTGHITTPPPERVLFLPQKPYMILSNLRGQLCYPGLPANHSDDELQAVLERVNLPNLAALHGGFGAQEDWGRILSLGEQQRIGFARFLLNRPDYVFLDEATSALDHETEERMYGLLAHSRATFISVGHRATIIRHHVQMLRLLPGGGWELTKVLEAARATGAPGPVQA